MRVEKFPDWHEDLEKAYQQLPEDTLKRGEEILSNKPRTLIDFH